MKRTRSYFLLLISFFLIAPSFVSFSQDISFDDVDDIEISYEQSDKDVLFKIDPKKGLDVFFPLLGEISFKKSDRSDGGFIAKIPKDGKPIKIGPLVINHGEASLVGTKMKCVLKGTLFGKKVSFGLREVRLEKRKTEEIRQMSKSVEENVFGKGKILRHKELKTNEVEYPVLAKVRLGIKFEENASVEWIPGVRFTFSQLDLVFDWDDKSLVINGKAKLFDRPVDVEISIAGPDSFMKGKIKNLSLVKVVPQLKGTVLEPVKVSGEIGIKNLFVLFGAEEKKDLVSLYLNGSADLSKLNLGPIKTGTIKKAKTKLKINIERFFFEAELQKIKAGKLGQLDKVRLVAKKERQESPSVTLYGKGVVKLADQPIKYDLKTKLEGLNIIFRGKTSTKFKLGDLDLATNANLEFNTKTADLTIKGKAQIKDFGIEVVLKHDQDGRLEASGKLLVKKIKPFKDLKVPGLSDISLVDPKVRLINKDSGWGFEITGAVKISPNQKSSLQLNGRLYFSTGSDVLGTIERGLKAEDKVYFEKLIKEPVSVRVEDLDNLPHLYASQYYKDVLKNKKGAVSEIKYGMVTKDKDGKLGQKTGSTKMVTFTYADVEEYAKEKAKKEASRLDVDAFTKEVIKVMAQYSHSKNILVKREREGIKSEKAVKKKTSGGKTSAQAKKYIILEVFLSPHSKLSALFPELKDTVFDSLDLESADLIISSGPYYDRKRDMDIVQGINFHGAGRISGALAQLIKKTGWADLENAAPMKISGGIGIPDPLKSRLKMSLATGLPFTVGKVLDLPFGFQFKFGELQLELLGSPTPRAALIVTNHVRQSKNDEWCKLAARGTIETTGILSGAGTLQGVWKDPLGIKGVELGDIAVEIGLDPKLLAVGYVVPFTLFGITGYFGVQLNPETLEKNPLNRVRFAGKVSVTQPNDIVLKGYLNRLTLKDAAGAIKAIYGIDIPQDKVPDLGLEDLSLNLTTMKTKIGELTFDQGIGGSGTLLLPQDKKAQVKLFMNQQGLVVRGFTPTIKVGELMLSGAGPDGKFGPPAKYDKDNGPIVSLTATIPEQRLLLSGIAKIADLLKGKAHVILEPKKAVLDMEGKIKEVLDVKVKGEASLFDLKFDLLIDFTTSLIRKIQDGVNGVVITLQKEAKKAVKNLSELVSKLGVPLKDIDQKKIKADIAKKEKDIEAIKKAMVKKGNFSLAIADDVIKVLQAKKSKFDKSLASGVENELNKAIAGINKAFKDLEPLRQKAKATQTWWNSLPVFCWPWQGCSRTTCLAKYVAEKAVFEGPLKIAEAALTLARNVLQNIVKKLVKAALDVGVKLTKPFEEAAADIARIIVSNPLVVQEARKAAAIRAEIFGLKRLLEVKDLIAQGMKGLERFIDFSAQAGTFAVKTFAPPFHVERVYANVSLGEFALQQKLPKVSVDFTLFGVKHKITDLQINLNDSPEKIQKQVVDAVVAFIKGSPS